jgi:hypothetical protein
VLVADAQPNFLKRSLIIRGDCPTSSTARSFSYFNRPLQQTTPHLNKIWQAKMGSGIERPMGTEAPSQEKNGQGGHLCEKLGVNKKKILQLHHQLQPLQRLSLTNALPSTAAVDTANKGLLRFLPIRYI